MNNYILLCKHSTCKKAWQRYKEDFIYCCHCIEPMCSNHSVYIQSCPICSDPLYMFGDCYTNSTYLAQVNDNIANQTTCDWHHIQY